MKRRDTVTRTYPIFRVPPSDLSDDDDDESIIEIRPIKRRRKHRSKVRPQEPIPPAPKPQAPPKPVRKSATIQTDATPDDDPSKKKSRCNRGCLRIFAIILAVFILIISILLLTFAVNLLVNPNITKLRSVAIVYPQALPSSGFTGKGPTDTLLVTGIISVIVGSIMFILSIFAIVCLICIKFRYYGCCFFTGPVLLIILFFILIGFAIFIIITGETELQRLAYSTQITVYYYYNSTTTLLVRSGWDFVQYYFDCCGVISNNTDWYPTPSTGWQTTSQLPRSCCGYDPNDIGHAGRIFVALDVPALTGFCYYGDIGKSTCYSSIKSNLLITVLVFLIVTGILILFLAILTIILIILYRTTHQKAEDSVKK